VETTDPEKSNYLRIALSQGIRGSITAVLSQNTEGSVTKNNKEPFSGLWKAENKSSGKRNQRQDFCSSRSLLHSFRA
jgi:hypothetical protein